MTIIDHKAEGNVLVGLLDGVIPLDEVLAEIDEHHFQTAEGKAVYNLFLSCHRYERFSKSMLTSQTQDPATRAYIEQINRMSVNESEMRFFMEKLQHTHLRNECIRRAGKIIQLAERETTSSRELTAAMERMSMDYSGGREKRDILLPGEYAERHKQAYLQRYENPEEFQGMQLVYKNEFGDVLGFPNLNETFMGLRGGDLLMFCAQSGHGKTTLALNLARVLSVEQDYVTYYLNMEMGDQELDDRIVSAISMVPATEIATGVHEKVSDHIAVLDAYERVRQSNLILSQIPILTITKAKALAKMVRKKMQGLQCLIVDYVGRLEPEDGHGMQEWQQLYRSAERLKTLAVELDVPVIALAQLNEAGMLEGAKKMKNACDGVIFFQPIDDKDRERIDTEIFNADKRRAINYKMVKYKVRRNDNSDNIWCRFAKKYQLVTEI